MAKKTMRCLLMLTLLLIFSGLSSVFAAQETTILDYEVKYAPEQLETPMDWYNSSYFNNPDYKENRFVQYWVETPITPGGTRDTGFYMVYNEEGLYIFYQSNEPDRDANGVLLNSSIEFFLQTGLDIPYHQLIIQTNDSPFEYYEWQTENRNNRPLQDNAIVTNEEIPTGWGTVVKIPWEVYYDHVPLNGEDWKFSMIRWGPSGFSPTWGGHVHQVGRFNTLDFQAPSATLRTAIQKNIIIKAWDNFNTTAALLQTTWLNGDAYDEGFYNDELLPLIALNQTYGSQIPNLDSLSAAEIDELYQHIDDWFQLRYDVEDLRIKYNRDALFQDNEPPTVTDATYSTTLNTSVSGSVIGEDPDGDTLSYVLGDTPTHGVADVSSDGNWTYTPDEDYTGSDQFKVIVSDPSGGTATSTIDLLVTLPPVIELILDRTVVSPPNHKMVPIQALITHSDGASSISSFELTSITSNEDDNVTGDGNTINDIQNAEFGTADTSFSLRAERSGSGDGRIYTVTYTVTDNAGVTSTVSATVTVPKGND